MNSIKHMGEPSHTQYNNLNNTNENLPRTPEEVERGENPLPIPVGVYINSDIQTVPGIVLTGKTGFIFKVLNYVIGQLLLTSLVCSIAYSYKTNLHTYIYYNPAIIIIPFIVSFVSLGGLYFIKNFKARITLFVLFTISNSTMIAYTIIQYSPNIIFKAVLTTTFVVFGVNIYAYQCANYKKDFSFVEVFGYSGIVTLFTLSFMQLFIQNTLFEAIIIVLGVIIFTSLLLYDLNRLYSEDIGIDDPLITAITIYLDIINLFLYLVELFRCMLGNND